jgi:hypothetical protein
MIRAPHIRTQAQYISARRRLHIPITQESKPIPVPPTNVVILHSRVFDRLQEVDGRTRPEVDAVLDFPVFEPASASGQCLLVADVVWMEGD